MNKNLEISNSPYRVARIRWTAVLLITAALAWGGQTVMGGTIAGTPHDLSTKGWGTTELCKFCHTPHLAQNVTGAPLWNHKTTVASYTMYSSATFQGVTTQAQPGPTSKLCLSCHDGTVAIDAFANGGVLQTGTHFMTSTNLVGGGATPSLSGDHPIAFTYDAALASADSALVTPSSASYVDAGHLIPLYATKMECASCHASHDNTYGKFLRISNAGSAMCLKCHIK
jgi:predicted CXXCH cytochrome family protein